MLARSLVQNKSIAAWADLVQYFRKLVWFFLRSGRLIGWLSQSHFTMIIYIKKFKQSITKICSYTVWTNPESVDCWWKIHKWWMKVFRGLRPRPSWKDSITFLAWGSSGILWKAGHTSEVNVEVSLLDYAAGSWNSWRWWMDGWQ